MLQVPWDFNITDKFSWVQLLSRVWLFATPWTAARQASLYITSSQSLPKLMSIESDAIQPSHPLLSPSPSALNLSQHQSLFNESALRIRWPKYWSFSFNISPSNEHPGLISFRMDLLNLLAVQGTLKSLLQHHSSNASMAPHKSNIYTETWRMTRSLQMKRNKREYTGPTILDQCGTLLRAVLVSEPSLGLTNNFFLHPIFFFLLSFINIVP